MQKKVAASVGGCPLSKSDAWPSWPRLGRIIPVHDLVGRKINRFFLKVAGSHRCISAAPIHPVGRSEEHTSELQSLMRTSYAVFCLKKKTSTTIPTLPCN